MKLLILKLIFFEDLKEINIMSSQDYITDYRDMAYRILIEIEELKCCEFHSDYCYRTYKYGDDQIYAVATNKIKEKLNNESIDFSLFHDSIKYNLDEAGDSSKCPICEAEINKIMSE